jgi:hypothetical protein
VATGGLILACAAGLHRVLADGQGALWAPRLVAVIGGGLADTSALMFGTRSYQAFAPIWSTSPAAS